jgi:hypothetical protein
MSVSLNRFSTTIVAVAVMAAVLGLGSALGATPPTGMSAQEYRAEVIRSQALNDLYGEPEVTSQYKAMVRADRIRGEAMNRLARSGVFTAPPAPSDNPDPVLASTSGREFEWPQIGIGFVFGLVLALGVFLVVRLKHIRPVTR